MTVFLSACGLGQGNLELPEPRPNGTVKGKVLGGLYVGGKISAYTADNQQRRQFLASAEIQQDSSFTLDFAGSSQLILLEASEGQYLDPGNFELVDPEPAFKLSSIVKFNSGESTDASLTPMTHLAAGYLLFNLESKAETIDESALASAIHLFNDLYSIDLGNAFLDIQYQPESRLLTIEGDEKQGLLIFALAHIAHSESLTKVEELNSQFNLSTLTNLIYEDIRADGLLDGKSYFDTEGDTKTLAYGETAIDHNFYRLKMAFALRRGLGLSTVSIFKDKQEEDNYLFLIAQSKSSLFTTVNDDALYESTPIIRVAGDYSLPKNNTFNLEFLVDNALKVEAIKFFLDDAVVDIEPERALLSSNARFSIAVDTSDLSDGQHQMGLAVKDSFENIGVFETFVTFDNTAPSLSINSASLTNESEFLLKGLFSDEFSQVKSIVVDDQPVSLNSETEWQQAVSLNSGHNQFVIKFEDELGNQGEIHTHVLYDKFAPLVTLSSARLANTHQFLLEGVFIDGESGIKSIAVNDNPATIKDDNKWSALVSLNRGNNEFVIGIEDEAGNQGEFFTEIYLDDVSPEIHILSAALTNDPAFLLEGEIVEHDLGNNTVLVNGVATNVEDNKWSLPVNLSAGKNSFVISIEDKVGNYSELHAEVILDSLAPVVTLTSGGLSNISEFLLTGHYVEGLSEIKNLTVNGNESTLLADNEWELLVNLNSGNNEFLIATEDIAGNASEFSTAVYLDDVSPALTVTSKTTSNNVQYLLEGEYSEAESGVQKIRVNGSEANILADQKWSLLVPLEPGNNELTVNIADKAGNSVETTHTVLLDDQAPLISYLNPIETRFSNNDGSFRVDSLTLNTDTPLFIEIMQLSLSGLLINKENLNNASIPYFVFDVSDQGLAGLETARQDLKIDYRYLINETEIVTWQAVSADEMTGEVLLPLVSETLSNAWYKVKPEDEHKVELRVSDVLGNTSTESMSFKAQFYVPELEVLADDGIASLADMTFDSRADYINKSIVAQNYKLHNFTDRNIKIQLSDTGAHLVEQDYEEVLRENKLQLHSMESWQKASMTDLGNHACPQLNDDWQPLTNLWNRVGGEWIEIFPDVKELDVVNVFTDEPVPPTSLDWSNYSANDEEIALVNYDTDGERLSYYYDYLFNLDTVSLKTASGNPGFVKGWTLILANGEVIPDGDPCSDVISVQTRTDYSYTTVDENNDGIADYPRNNLALKSVSSTFDTSKIEVLNESNDVIADSNGWFEIPANHTVTIVKTVNTPSLVLYSDDVVVNPDSIEDYELHALDKQLIWNINQALSLDTQFNPDNNLDELTNIRQQRLLDTTKIIEVTRN